MKENKKTIKETFSNQKEKIKKNKKLYKAIKSLPILIFYLIFTCIFSYFLSTLTQNYTNIITNSLLDKNISLAVHNSDDINSNDLKNYLDSKNYSNFKQFLLPYDDKKINSEVYSKNMANQEKLSTINKLVFDVYSLEDDTKRFTNFSKEQNTNIASLNNSTLKKFNFTLDGNLPENDNEIVVTKFVYEAFKETGYKKDSTVSEITKPSDLIGKKITLNIAKNISDENYKEFTIVGIIDTKIDLSSYKETFKNNKNINFKTVNQFRKNYSKNIILNTLFVTDNFINTNKDLFEFSNIQVSLNRNDKNQLKEFVSSIEKINNKGKSNYKVLYVNDSVFSLMDSNISKQDEVIRATFFLSTIAVLAIFIMMTFSNKYDIEFLNKNKKYMRNIVIRNLVFLIFGVIGGLITYSIVSNILNAKFASIMFINNILVFSPMVLLMSFIASLVPFAIITSLSLTIRHLRRKEFM